MAHTQETIAAELKRIQESVPSILRQGLVKTAMMTPTIKKVAMEALRAGATKPELKEKIKNMLDSGALDKPKYVVDPKKAKAIDDFIRRETAKSVKAGKLPRKVYNNYKQSAKSYN